MRWRYNWFNQWVQTEIVLLWSYLDSRRTFYLFSRSVFTRISLELLFDLEAEADCCLLSSCFLDNIDWCKSWLFCMTRVYLPVIMSYCFDEWFIAILLELWIIGSSSILIKVWEANLVWEFLLRADLGLTLLFVLFCYVLTLLYGSL